jgi:hypothetical protein
LDGSAALEAVTDNAAVLLTFGAVNKPPEEIVPELAVHTIDVADVLAKLAVNCSVAPGDTTALTGDTVGRTLFEAGVFAADCDAVPDPQLAVARMRASRHRTVALCVD